MERMTKEASKIRRELIVIVLLSKWCEGKNNTQAYKLLSEIFHVSPSTIRDLISGRYSGRYNERSHNKPVHKK